MKLSKLRDGEEWIDVSTKAPKGKTFKVYLHCGTVLENVTRFRSCHYPKNSVHLLRGKCINEQIYNEYFDDFYILPISVHEHFIYTLIDSKGNEGAKEYVTFEACSVVLLFFNQKK